MLARRTLRSWHHTPTFQGADRAAQHESDTQGARDLGNAGNVDAAEKIPLALQIDQRVDVSNPKRIEPACPTRGLSVRPALLLSGNVVAR